jgi:gamma-glutamyltranspeptidase / glutathione hydrolase
MYCGILPQDGAGINMGFDGRINTMKLIISSRLAGEFKQARILFGLLMFSLLCCVTTVSANSAAIASAHRLATEAGEAVIIQGGNAFDAAVAVTAALAVVEPYSSGLGGGGFWLLHRALDKRDVMIDGRETAPGKATERMYLDDENKPIRGASLNGPGAAAIPGTPAALVHIASNYGNLTLAKSLAPAIRLARDGFKIDARFARAIKNHQNKLRRDHNAARIFLPAGTAPAAGSIFRQPQLAATLTAISKHGKNGFYRGHVAQEMVQSVTGAGGIWAARDLSRYRIVERKPVKFTYRGTQVTTASLPSAGGLSLAQGLNILENFSLSTLNQSDRTHLIVEALRHAFQDRASYLGDSDFVNVPERKLMSKDYARERASKISVDRVYSKPDRVESMVEEGAETTHFSIMDGEGNRVAATMSINTFFGSGFVAGETGVLLNNEMDDFSIGDNMPNVYGLHGGKANNISPGKRPLSSMSPTFLENEKGILIVGTPGGSRIISMLLLVIVDYVDNQQASPMELVSRPRFHHQYRPDRVEIESDAFDDKWIAKLVEKGHVVKTEKRRWGNMQLIFFDKESRQSYVASDPRGKTDTRY